MRTSLKPIQAPRALIIYPALTIELQADKIILHLLFVVRC
jgi:hypothetical protein